MKDKNASFDFMINFKPEIIQETIKKTDVEKSDPGYLSVLSQCCELEENSGNHWVLKQPLIFKQDKLAELARGKSYKISYQLSDAEKPIEYYFNDLVVYDENNIDIIRSSKNIVDQFNAAGISNSENIAFAIGALSQGGYNVGYEFGLKQGSELPTSLGSTEKRPLLFKKTSENSEAEFYIIYRDNKTKLVQSLKLENAEAINSLHNLNFAQNSPIYLSEYEHAEIYKGIKKNRQYEVGKTFCLQAPLTVSTSGAFMFIQPDSNDIVQTEVHINPKKEIAVLLKQTGFLYGMMNDEQIPDIKVERTGGVSINPDNTYAVLPNANHLKVSSSGFRKMQKRGLYQRLAKYVMLNDDEVELNLGDIEIQNTEVNVIEDEFNNTIDLGNEFKASYRKLLADRILNGAWLEEENFQYIKDTSANQPASADQSSDQKEVGRILRAYRWLHSRTQKKLTPAQMDKAYIKLNQEAPKKDWLAFCRVVLSSQNDHQFVNVMKKNVLKEAFKPTRWWKRLFNPKAARNRRIARESIKMMPFSMVEKLIDRIQSDPGQAVSNKKIIQQILKHCDMDNFAIAKNAAPSNPAVIDYFRNLVKKGYTHFDRSFNTLAYKQYQFAHNMLNKQRIEDPNMHHSNFSSKITEANSDNPVQEKGAIEKSLLVNTDIIVKKPEHAEENLFGNSRYLIYNSFNNEQNNHQLLLGEHGEERQSFALTQ